ncbi:MAG TPA: hypothetical protein VJV23_10535 [Candidatus Polarisedimenticolia bacterium]|nr:hypothetical protein [Candidatus Polarisedimenticolia bacterium]
MRFRQHALVVAVVLAVVALSAGAASASTFLKVDINDLRKMSETVIHARVAEIRSDWNAEGTMIFTEVAFEVKGRLHGRSEDLIVARVPGGTVGDYTIEMFGAPRFDQDEEVVVFIGRWNDGTPMVAGYEAGVSRIQRDPLGNAILKGGQADGMPLSELARQLRQSR